MSPLHDISSAADPAPEPRRLDLPIAIASVTTIAVPLLHGASGGAYADADRMIWATAFGLIATWALLAGALPAAIQNTRRPDMASIGAWLYLAGSGIAALLTSVPSTALFGDVERRAGVLSDIALVSLFFGARHLGQRIGAARTTLLAALIGGIVLCTVALFQGFGLPPIAQFPIPRPGSLLGGPTYLGAFAAAMLPLALTVVAGRWRILCVLLVITTLFLSGARVSALAAAIGGAIAVGSLSAKSRRPMMLGVGAIVLLIATLAIPAVARHLPDGLLPTRITSLFSGPDAHDRKHLYQDAIEASVTPRRALLTGHGPDTIGTLFSASISSETARRFGGRTHIDRLHSNTLDTLFTRGSLALLGLLLMVGAALRLGLGSPNPSTGSSTSDDPGSKDPSSEDPIAKRLRYGAAGVVAATFIDGALAVPGAVSQLWLFVGCGILSGFAAANGTRGATESVRAGSNGDHHLSRPLLAALGVVVTIYALPLSMSWLALIWLALLSDRERNDSLRSALAIAGIYVIAAIFTRGAGAATAQAAESHATRGQINLLLTIGAVSAIVFFLVRPSLRRPSRRPSTVFFAVIALFIIGIQVDLFGRLFCAIEARAATDSQIAGAPPRAAEELLAAAATRAPESPRYAALTLLALVDRANQISDDPEKLRAAVDEAGHWVEAIVQIKPVEARSLTLAARAVVRLTGAAPAFETELQRHAAMLSQSAVKQAPYSTPTLATAAEILMRGGDIAGAREYIERGQALEGDDPDLRLLLARAESHDHDLSAAAHHYGLALPHLSTAPAVLEARLAIAIAAAARSSTEDSAGLITSAAELVRSASPLDLSPVRPLLHFIDEPQRRAVFERARYLRRDLAKDIDAIEEALVGSP